MGSRAAPAESQDFFAHGSVAGQPFGVGFGVTAPQIQAVQGRGQVHVLQRRKGHQFGSGLAQAAQILLVVKTEGPVPGVADADFRNPGPAVRDGRAGHVGQGFQQGVQIEGAFHPVRQSLQALLAEVQLFGRDQTQMPRRQMQSLLSGQAAQHADVRQHLHDLGQQLAMNRASGHVEQHRVQGERRVEFGVALDQSCHGAGHALNSGHEQHGHVQNFGQLSRGALFA